jgi:GNAT superfamily N-acetyltransferase
MAGARAAAIKNGILGNTIKWGAGQPLEFLGGAVRNTIDYGLEKAGDAFEATTGMEAKQFAQTARMSGIGFSASSVAGHAIPYASTISDAYIVGSSARGFGEALTLVGETMSKNKFGRGINSWATEALEQAEKNGVALSPHAKGLLKALNAVDPLFAYGWNGLEGAAEGALIGGGLGYASGGAEGMYSGIGAGVALGGVGATAGKMVADVTGGTGVARRAVQAKMVIEGHKVTNPEKAMFFQAMQKATEARGQDVDLVNSIIAGIDKVAPNFEFHAMTPEMFVAEGISKGYNPATGKFVEVSGLDMEFGGDRASKSKAMYILRSVGGDFVGDSKAFLEALKKASAKDSANPNRPAGNIPANLRKYTDVARAFDKLTKTQQDAVLKEIDGQTEVAKELGGSTKLREHYDALTWSEAWTDSLVKKFESDREGARKDITDMLAQETKKDGTMTKKGRALVDKLRAEGFLDKEGKLLRQRNLLQADMTLGQFSSVKGGVIRREADGKTHMYINLNLMGSETFPHELFHTVMRESPMKDHFTKSLIQKLVGTFDDKGRLVRKGEVNINQLRKFFKKYVDLTSFDEDGSTNLKKAEDTMTAIETALKEYETYGDNKKISEKSRDLLENYTEEFGAYYFSHWLMGRNRNTLFFGGELKGIEGLVERTKDGFMDFWQSKISKANPEFDFSRGLNESFDRSKGLGRISAIDYYMRDMVRAASNANRDAFRPDSMTLENLRDFETSNGLRNLTTQNGSRRLNPPERKRQNQTLGKEGFKILSGLDKNLRTSKDTIDENGKPVITGRLSEAELDALVKGGIVPRAWADKVNQGYAMLDGTVSNIFSAGYLGNTEQTTDASYPRLTGKDVSFKNRKAVLFDVETKIKADGTFYTLFHTLDLAVIEQRGNHLWQNTDYRNMWDGDRGAMEADFFRYISNASKASTDTSKLDSAALLEKGDGLGAARRDVLQQMAGMALQIGDAYKHQPIAVIPEGIRHSVTTFNIDGLTTPRVEQGARYDIDMKNAHKFIRENWQPDDMRQEKTPAGRVLTHESGFKFTQDANGKVSAYTSAGAKIGTFNSIKEATVAGKNKFNEVYKNHDAEVKKVFEKKNEEAKRFQALDENERQEAIRNGDLFSLERVKNFIGNRKVLRQSREEFIISKVIEAVENPEILKNAVRKALFSTNKTAFEYRKLLQEFVKVGEEEKRLADEHGVLYQQWLKTTDADERSMLSQKMTENSEAAQVLQVQRPKAKFNLERFELEMKKARVDAFVELQNSLSHLTQEQFTEVVKNELMLTYTPELGGKYKAIKKAHSGIAETLFAEAFDDQTQTGVPIVVVGTHGTRNVELMISRILLDEKLGSRYGVAAGNKAYSSDLGHFMGGSTDTSSSYSGIPPSAFTEYAKNGIPVNRLAEFLGDGAFLNPYGFQESHPVYRLNKAIFELKKNSQKVNDALLFKAQDAYLELFDKGDKLSYDDLLAKAREVQGILSHLKDIRYISDNAHRRLINLTVEAFDKSVRKERQNRISRDEFNDYLNNAEALVINPMFSPLDEMRVSVDELLGGELKNQDKEIKLPEGKSIKVKYDNELYKEVIKLSQETINTLTDTKNGWMGKTNFENKVKMVIGGKKFYEGSSTVDPAKTWMQIRMLMAFDNPKVIIDPRGYDESKLAPQMIQAINEGHDGIIFKRLRDGGSEDDIYIQLKGNQNKILTIDTSFDSQHIPRKDENGNVLKTGRDIGLALQPDEINAPKQVQGIKLDMTKAYDVFRKEYEESTGQSWTMDKFMQRASNWQFFGDENGFVAVRPQRSGFVKLVGMAGDNKSKLRGIQQIQQQGLPIWGMVSKEIKDMAVKRGMREPNMIERTVLKQALNSAALGDAEILGYTSDNGVRLRYPDIGEVTKYMIGSPEYYQKLRSAFGEQVKNKMGFQPDEPSQGGRVYDQNSREFKTGFIGKWAEENPERLKGYDLEFIDRGTKYGTHNVRIRLQDNSTVGQTENVGHITADIDPKTKVASLSSNIGAKYRGNKLSYALYSEMAERLRSMGVTKVDGTIINPEGIPIKVREKIIGNTRVLRSDGSSGVPINYQQGARIIQRRQAENGNSWGGLDVVNELDFNARYQPDDYQGGDDYYKKGKRKDGVKIPKQYKDFPTSPEGVDEFGAKIRYVRYFDPKSGQIKEVENFPFTYMEIGHEINSKNVFLWSLNNANFKKYGVHENSPITIGSMASMMRDKQSPFHGYGNQSLSDVRGRIEMPVLDEKGNITEKGRVSIGVIAGAEGKVTLPQFRLLKEKIIKSLGLPALTEKDFDFWLYTADRDIRSQFGLSEKDKGGIKFQPDEGGRTYNDKQMSGEFIGRYASENPKATKGLKPKFNIFSSGDEGNIELVRGQDTLGYINFSFSKATGDALIEYTRVADKHQGKGYGNLLYSELVERLRSMGMKEVQGMIIDEQGRPQKIRERIIDKENARIGGDKTQIDYVEKDPDSDATQTGVTSYLYNDAWYQPDEPSIIGIEEIAEARRIGNLFKTKGMQEFVGDRELVPQTADEGFIDFINRFKEENINQQTALYMLDEMSKGMFGGLDRQMLRVRRQELIDRNPDAKNAVRGMEWKRMSLQDASEFKKIEDELDKPALKEKKHSDFTAGVARDFAEKISKAKEWVKKASPTYNDFSGYIADNVPMREYYQHAVYSSKFKTGQPVAVVGVHGTYTSQGFLKDKKYKHEIRVQDYPLEKGEMRGAYFASSDSTVLNPEYQGYDPKKLGYEIDPTFRRPESDKPNIAKSVIRFDNPLVVNGQFADIMKRTEKILGEAIEKGHDGVIYINQMDGGNLDVSFIVPADKANQHQRMIGSTREKNMEGNSYEPLPRGEGLTNRTANLQPDEYIPNQERAKELRSLIDSIPHYKEALESGQLTIDEYNPEAFKGLQVLAHAPDTASTVETPSFIAQGGMGYPLLFKGEGWASVSRGLEKRLNRIGEANFKKTGKWQAPMALIMAHPFKMSGARNGAEGFVNVLKKMRDRNIISDATLTQALKYALERAGVQGIGEKVYIGDMLGKTQKLLENSTSSGFNARAKFVKDVSGYVAKNSRQLSTIKLNRISDIIPDYPAGAKLTSKELIPAVFDMFVDPLLRGVDTPDSKMGGKVYAYVLFDKPLIEHSGSPHKSYNYSVKHNDNSPVRVDILSNPVEPIKSFTEKTYASGKSVPLKERTITNDTGQRNFPYGQVKHAQPIEYTQFTTEQTASGRILKNAKGYAIIMVNNKFRVYNPTKAILGVYNNEEEAKKRIYREIPKR